LWSKRQKVFRDAKMRTDRVFTEQHVWTFTMYQSQVDMARYGLDVGLRFDLTNHLDGQPLQFMMKDRFRCCLVLKSQGWAWLPAKCAKTVLLDSHSLLPNGSLFGTMHLSSTGSLGRGVGGGKNDLRCLNFKKCIPGGAL